MATLSGWHFGHRERRAVGVQTHNLLPATLPPPATCYGRILPFYDAAGMPVSTILTDNGCEFCGKPESHPYELLLTTNTVRRS